MRGNLVSRGSDGAFPLGCLNRHFLGGDDVVKLVGCHGQTPRSCLGRGESHLEHLVLNHTG